LHHAEGFDLFQQEGGALLEHEKKQTRRPKKRKKSIVGRIIGGFFFCVFTLCLIGLCTAVMMGGLFKKYVDTTLAPIVQVDAADYTMKLSSIIYYEDQDTGDWTELQTVHGKENRIWVDFKDMPEEYQVTAKDNREMHWLCDCSMERLEKVLMTIGVQDLRQIIEEDGQAEMVCQFCCKKYHFDKEHLEAILQACL
jgi:hypothetical protein